MRTAASGTAGAPVPSTSCPLVIRSRLRRLHRLSPRLAKPFDVLIAFHPRLSRDTEVESSGRGPAAHQASRVGLRSLEQARPSRKGPESGRSGQGRSSMTGACKRPGPISITVRPITTSPHARAPSAHSSRGRARSSSRFEVATAGTYAASFWASLRWWPAGSHDFDVILDGKTLGRVGPTQLSPYTWRSLSFPAELAAGRHTLRFQGVNTKGGDFTSFVEDVRVATAAGGGPLRTPASTT